jgi:transposase
VTDWLEDNKDRIEVFYLPPYSPEVNPDEYLNRDLKTMLRSSDRSENQGELFKKAATFMESLKKMPERVISYFKHANVRYASLYCC